MTIAKERILSEIRRVAAENGGAAPGRRTFLAESGIKDTDWQGIYWVRWGDAVREAGLAPNTITAAIPHEELLTRLANLTRELGHYPVAAEFRMKVRTDPTFPSEKTFRQFGGKRSLMAKLRAFCDARGNTYRFVAQVKYAPLFLVFVRFVGTHAEYDRIDANEV